MTTTENLDSVMRRVQKLMAIAEHERSDPNEAAAAAGMAEKIMRKYQIEQSDVIMASLKKGDDLGTEDVLATAKTNGTPVKKVPLWAGWIAVGVSKLNDCGARICHNSKGEAVVRFFGFTADVKIAGYMLTYLLETTNRLCNEFKKTPEYAMGGRSLVNSYRQGVAMGITSSINALVKAKTEQVAASTGTSLIVVKSQAIAERYGSFGTSVSKTSVSRGGAFYNGVADGKNVSVRTAITGREGQKALN